MTTDPITDAARVLLGKHLTIHRVIRGVECECGVNLTESSRALWSEYVRNHAAHIVTLLAEAGLLVAPDLLQVGPRLGASACDDDGISVCPKMAYSNKQIGRERDGLRAQVEAMRAAIEREASHGDAITRCNLVAERFRTVLDSAAAPQQAPADPPAGVESGQDGSGAVRGVVEDRMRALAADMDRDTPLTAEILRQFANEVTHLRAAGDRAIQSIVSRLPDGTYPTTPDGK